MIIGNRLSMVTLSKNNALKEVDTITNSLKNNFQLLDLKTFNCAKTGELL